MATTTAPPPSEPEHDFGFSDLDNAERALFRQAGGSPHTVAATMLANNDSAWVDRLVLSLCALRGIDVTCTSCRLYDSDGTCGRTGAYMHPASLCSEWTAPDGARVEKLVKLRVVTAPEESNGE